MNFNPSSLIIELSITNYCPPYLSSKEIVMRNKKNAFTLIELLVVIGIIFVLASFLAPALLRAKEQANRASCLANIRSLGQAMQIYANENDDRFSVGGSGSTYNTNLSFGAIFNAKSFNDTKIYICPNRKRNSPPDYTPSSSSLTTDAISPASGRIISYVIVMNDDGSGNPAKPMASDFSSNIFLMEDPAADAGTGSNVQFDNGDNHGTDGCNTYHINGQATWYKGTKISGSDSSSLPLKEHKDANVAIDGTTKYTIDFAHLVRQNP